jgi:hypothetical protein
MSLKETNHTLHWKTIPKKCKNCSRSIYTIEDNEVIYQCNLFGKFIKDCEIKAGERLLPKPEEILKLENN